MVVAIRHAHCPLPASTYTDVASHVESPHKLHQRKRERWAVQDADLARSTMIPPTRHRDYHLQLCHIEYCHQQLFCCTSKASVCLPLDLIIEGTTMPVPA